jgi:hypothetical protein
MTAEKRLNEFKLAQSFSHCRAKKKKVETKAKVFVFISAFKYYQTYNHSFTIQTPAFIETSEQI